MAFVSVAVMCAETGVPVYAVDVVNVMNATPFEFVVEVPDENVIPASLLVQVTTNPEVATGRPLESSSCAMTVFTDGVVSPSSKVELPL
jgi:hypothetical protein